MYRGYSKDLGKPQITDDPYIIFEHLWKGLEQSIGLLFKVHLVYIWIFTYLLIYLFSLTLPYQLVNWSDYFTESW